MILNALHTCSPNVMVYDAVIVNKTCVRCVTALACVSAFSNSSAHMHVLH